MVPHGGDLSQQLRWVGCAGALLLLARSAAPAPIHAQVCDLVRGRCNYAKQYKGTITYSATLAGEQSSDGQTRRIQRVTRIVISVDSGRVTCSGTEAGEDVRTDSRGVVRREQSRGTISGAGLLMVERPGARVIDRGGSYKLEAACPSPAITETVSRRDEDTRTRELPSEPADLEVGAITSPDKVTADFAVLEGSETFPHPHADRTNNISGEATLTWRLRARPAERVQANPGGPYRARRAEQLMLNGSASRGTDLSYRWTFAQKDCPINTSAAKEGASPTVTLLCSVQAVLTVTDGFTTDTRSALVTVGPRGGDDWKTPFTHSDDDLKAFDEEFRPLVKSGPDGPSLGLTGAINSCLNHFPATVDHTLDPLPSEAGSWDGVGYELAQVNDPGGPFHDYWYVSAYKLKVERRIVMSGYILPGGRPAYQGGASFYETNRSAGTKVDAFLAALRAHEGIANATGVLGHSGLIRKQLTKSDPARTIEAKISSQARDALRRIVDDEIRSAEKALCEASKDPLPEIWRGELLFPRAGWGEYTRIATKVGGVGYGTSPCD